MGQKSSAPLTPQPPPTSAGEKKKFSSFSGVEMAKEALYCPNCGKKQQSPAMPE